MLAQPPLPALDQPLRFQRARSIEGVNRCIPESTLPRSSKERMSMKLAPPPQRSPTLKARTHSVSKSMPLTSIMHKEEEFLERELEMWIKQQSQNIKQMHSSSSAPPSSAPIQQATRGKLQRQLSQQVNPFEMHVTIEDGHDEYPYTPSLQRKPSAHLKAERTLIDAEPGDEGWDDHKGASYPTSKRDSKRFSSNFGPAYTFSRGSNNNSVINYNFLTLPRHFPSIPAIKPINTSDDAITNDKFHTVKVNKHSSAPCAISIPAYVRRKSLIPDPNQEQSALYTAAEDGKEVVLGGTLPQLVNSLTDERADIDFLSDFLYTYRYFTTADFFLQALQQRYSYTAPTSCTAEEKAVYDEWRGPVQLRVINCLKKWIEEHFYDFEMDPPLLDKLRSFIFSTVSIQNTKWANSLEEIIHSQLIRSINSGDIAINTEGLQSLEVLCALLKQSDLVQNRKWRLKNYRQCFVGQEAVDWMMLHMGLKSRQIVCTLGARLVAHDLIQCVSKERNEFRDTQHSYYQFTLRAEVVFANVFPSTPILPKNVIEMNLSNVDPKEIARQLTLIEFNMFKSIKLPEISFQAWTKNRKDSFNVVEMINRFNEVSFWTATEILSQIQLTSRVATLKKLIKIAHVCKKMNNYNTMMEIAAGLNMGAVARLVKTWAALDAKTKARYDELMSLTHVTNNCRAYRDKLKTITYPALPYLGLYLKDLTFIEDGNVTYLEESVVNFQKMRMLAGIFKAITDFQRHPYLFTPVPQLQKYLLHGVAPEQNDNELYKLSYLCELSRNSVKIPGGT